MLYPELFKQLEAVRWSMDTDIPWDRFDPAALGRHEVVVVPQGAGAVRKVAACGMLGSQKPPSDASQSLLCLIAWFACLGLARLSLDQRNPLDNDCIILLYIGPKRGY